MLGLGDRVVYFMGLKIVKKFNYFFFFLLERLYIVLGKRGIKVKYCKFLWGGGGLCFIVYLFERLISFNLSCGMC